MKSTRWLVVVWVLFLITLLSVVRLPVTAYPNDLPTASNTEFNSPLAGGAYAPDPNPILTNQLVRQGLAYCTDRWALAKAAFPALTNAEIDALMMDSFFPSDHWAYTQPAAQYPYNPTQGQLLLEQAGWTLPPGETYRVNAAGEELALVLTTTQAQLRYDYAEVLEAQWLDCGVRLVRLHAPSGWMFGDTTGLERRDFEVGSFAWVSGADPQIAALYACDQIPSELNLWTGKNYMGWCNPTASAAAHSGDNTSLTQAERKAFYAIVQEEFAEDVPSLPLFLFYPVNGAWEHLDFNITSPPPPPPALKELNFRRGLAYCTDRWALAKAAYPALTNAEIDALMLDSFFPSDHWAYTQPATQYPYNPTQGQLLLEQAGWTLPPGETYRVNAAGEELALVLTTTQAQLRYDYAEVLEAQWLACGVRLVRLHAPSGWLFGDTTGLGRRDFEIGSYAWIPDADPQIAPLYACDQIPSKFNLWSGKNYMGWCNPTASAAAHSGDNTSLTQAERKAFYAVVQEEFAEDVPSLPLFLRYPVDGTWEHLDFNLYEDLVGVYIPYLKR